MEKMGTKAKTFKTVGLMAVIIFAAKFMGLLRETLIANLYGQGYSTDVLNTATQIPLLFFDMTLGVAVLSTFVPVFNKYLEKCGKEKAMEFASAFTTVVGVIAILFSVLGVVFSKQIVMFMAPGYEIEKVSEVAHLLKILFPAITFTAIAYIMVGVLQSFGEFNIPSLISFVSNLIMILYLVIFKDKFGLEGIIVSMLVAWLVQLLIQLPSLKKKGFYYRLNFNFKHEGVLEAARLAVPVLVSSWVQPFLSVINMSFGSSMEDGAVTALNWANKIYIIMVGVFAYAVTNFIFPKLSRLGLKSNDDFGKTARESLSWIVFIIAFVGALFIALPENIIKVVFERGEFTSSNTNLTATALFYYSFGMVGFAVCEVLNKSYYALQNGKIPMFSSILGIAVNFVCAFLFVKVLKLGVGGLALSSAVSSLCMAVFLLVMINTVKNGVINKNFVFNMLKIIISSVVSCVVAVLVKNLMADVLEGSLIKTLIKMCICSAPALVVYLGMGALVKTDEMMFLLRKGKN